MLCLFHSSVGRGRGGHVAEWTGDASRGTTCPDCSLPSRRLLPQQEAAGLPSLVLLRKTQLQTPLNPCGFQELVGFPTLSPSDLVLHTYKAGPFAFSFCRKVQEFQASRFENCPCVTYRGNSQPTVKNCLPPPPTLGTLAFFYTFSVCISNFCSYF